MATVERPVAGATRWGRRFVELSANRIINFNTEGRPNTILVQNQNKTYPIYLSTDANLSATNYETKIDPLNYGIITRFEEIPRFYLLSPFVRSTAMVFEIYSEDIVSLLPNLIISKQMQRLSVTELTSAIIWTEINDIPHANAVRFNPVVINASRDITNCMITVEINPVRFIADGRLPTPTLGHLLNVGDVLKLNSWNDIHRFLVISTVTAGSRLTTSFSRFGLQEELLIV